MLGLAATVDAIVPRLPEQGPRFHVNHLTPEAMLASVRPYLCVDFKRRQDATDSNCSDGLLCGSDADSPSNLGRARYRRQQQRLAE